MYCCLPTRILKETKKEIFLQLEVSYFNSKKKTFFHSRWSLKKNLRLKFVCYFKLCYNCEDFCIALIQQSLWFSINFWFVINHNKFYFKNKIYFFCYFIYLLLYFFVSMLSVMTFVNSWQKTEKFVDVKHTVLWEK